MPTWGWALLASGVGAAFAYFLGHTSTKRSLDFDATPFTITAGTATADRHGDAVDVDAPEEDEKE